MNMIKINIDTQKCLEISEAEDPSFVRARAGEKMKKFYKTEAGKKAIESLRERALTDPRIRNTSRPKLHYLMTNIETGEEFIAEGRIGVSNMLGYDKFTSKSIKKFAVDRKKQNIYKIEIYKEN